MICVEIAFALPDRQKIIELSVLPGTTAQQAIVQSNLQSFFPEIDLALLPLGVFSHSVEADYLVQSGDRIELYRPLSRDPKEARRTRVKRKPRKGYQ